MPWHDTREHPLHTMEFPSRYAFAELDAEFDHFREFYRGMVKDRPQEICALLVDLSRVEKSEARNRKRIAAAMSELAELMKARCVGQAYVVEKPLVRAALTAVTWLRAPPWPARVFSKRPEAEVWLKTLLREERSSRPPSSSSTP